MATSRHSVVPSATRDQVSNAMIMTRITHNDMMFLQVRFVAVDTREDTDLVSMGNVPMVCIAALVTGKGKEV